MIADRRGRPRRWVFRLLSFRSMTAFTFSGLLGGRILAAVHGSYVPLFVIDVLTNLGFIAFIAKVDPAALNGRARSWRLDASVQ